MVLLLQRNLYLVWEADVHLVHIHSHFGVFYNKTTSEYRIASSDCSMIVGIFFPLKQFHLPCIFFPPPPLEKMIIILIYIQMVIIDENC